MGGGTEQVTPELLKQLADQLDEVRENLESAAEKIESGEVFGTAFTHYGLDMAAAYPSAHSFAVRDAKSKAAHVQTIQDRLRSTATTWASAETASTVNRIG